MCWHHRILSSLGMHLDSDRDVYMHVHVQLLHLQPLLCQLLFCVCLCNLQVLTGQSLATFSLVDCCQSLLGLTLEVCRPCCSTTVLLQYCRSTAGNPCAECNTAHVAGHSPRITQRPHTIPTIT